MLIWNENRLLIFRLLFTYEFYTLVPIAIIYLSRKAESVFLNTSQYFKYDTKKEGAKNWINSEIQKITSYKTASSKLVAATICVGFDIILFLIPDFRLNSPILSLLILLSLQAGFIMGGHAGYVILSSLFFFSKFKIFKVEAPFLTPISIIVNPLSNLFYLAATIALFLYLMHDIALSFTPFVQSNAMAFWFTFGAFFPLIVFLWVFYQVHVLMQNIKIHYIGKINSQIQRLYSDLKNNLSKENTDTLRNLIEIQNQIEHSKTWQFNLSSLFTFVTTTALPIGQIVLSHLGYI